MRNICFVILFFGLLNTSVGQAQPYIPKPKPAKTDYLVGCLYFAGWQTNHTRNPWAKIVPYPERQPVLGWYDEGSPEVMDWEIKWAAEHGISYFTFCWYREAHNLGQPLTDTSHHHRHALHDGFLQAKFRNKMKFSILWENVGGAGISSLQDLQQNLFPYWLNTYFKHPSYLVVDGKPVLHFYRLNKIVDELGGLEQAKAAIAWLNQACIEAGFKGIALLTDYRWATDFQALGIQATYVYALMASGDRQRPTPTQAIDYQAHFLKTWLQEKQQPKIASARMGGDPMPWQRKVANQPWYDPDLMSRWRLTPAEFEQLLARQKAQMDAQPAGSLGRRMLLISNWNEWGEGMYIAPHAQEGFGYLQAICRVFARSKKLPKPLTPAQVGRGPYNQNWKKFNPGQ